MADDLGSGEIVLAASSFPAPVDETRLRQAQSGRLIVIVFLSVIVVQTLLGAIAVGTDDSVVLRIIFNVIGSTLTAPIVAFGAAVIYFRLRELRGHEPQADV